jgi:hypothetical protein
MNRTHFFVLNNTTGRWIVVGGFTLWGRWLTKLLSFGMRGRVHYYICTNVSEKRSRSVLGVFSPEARNMWFRRNVSSYLSNQTASYFIRQETLSFLNFIILVILGIYIRHAKQMHWKGMCTSRCYRYYELQINCFESTERACLWMFTRPVFANCVR